MKLVGGGWCRVGPRGWRIPHGSHPELLRGAASRQARPSASPSLARSSPASLAREATLSQQVGLGVLALPYPTITRFIAPPSMGVSTFLGRGGDNAGSP